jgi:hypothetical protein
MNRKSIGFKLNKTYKKVLNDENELYLEIYKVIRKGFDQLKKMIDDKSKKYTKVEIEVLSLYLTSYQQLLNLLEEHSNKTVKLAKALKDSLKNLSLSYMDGGDTHDK